MFDLAISFIGPKSGPYFLSPGQSIHLHNRWLIIKSSDGSSTYNQNAAQQIEIVAKNGKHPKENWTESLQAPIMAWVGTAASQEVATSS